MITKIYNVIIISKKNEVCNEKFLMSYQDLASANELVNFLNNVLKDEYETILQKEFIEI